MGWLDRLAIFRARQSYNNERDREDNREARLKMERLRMRMNELRLQQQMYERELQYMLRLRHGAQAHAHTQTHTDAQTEDEIELLKKISAVKDELNRVHREWHMVQFHGDRGDLKKYYRHINRTRPFMTIFILALWFLLFWFGGVGVVWKIIILLFALATTVGSFFEIIFSFKIRDRLIRPVEHLIKGVSEISQGNYDVSIDEEGISEISTLITAFNEMAKKLGESEKLKMEYEENRRALVANISHDLKTPITSIEGYIEAITATPDIPPEKLETYLKVIGQNASYMNRLIDDLFLFSKLDMQKLDFRFEETRIRPFIADMMQEFDIELHEKNVAFRYEDALNTDTTVKLDAKRFYQVIRNLVDNAVKYGPVENLIITTRLYGNGDSVCLDIADNGPGIPAEVLPHIFERFYRGGDQARTKDLSSTGLGLAIARELIGAHGGEIAVTSKQGEGTRFTVSMPCLKEASQ